MATLEKIRSKSALLLIIVGAGLLAFIIGDFFTSGRTLFGTGTTIAKVDGNKIDIQEFQRRVQEASQQAQAQNQRMDNAVLQQQVLNSMIAEKLFENEINDLGLTVTDQELTEMMVGKNSQYVDRMVQQQLGVPTQKPPMTWHSTRPNTACSRPRPSSSRLIGSTLKNLWSA